MHHCHEMKLSLGEACGWTDKRLTHRQLVAWDQWHEAQKDEPSRSDHYLMQLTLEVHMLNYILSNTRPNRKISDFKLKWDKPAQQSKSKASANTPEAIEARDAKIKAEQAALKHSLGMGAKKLPTRKPKPKK